MKSFQLFVVALILSLGVISQQDDWKSPPTELLGDWVEDVELTASLGFDPEDTQQNVASTFKMEFFVSKQAAVSVVGKDEIDGAVKVIGRFRNGSHQIVGCGEMVKGSDSPEKILFFVTQSMGQSYVWLGDLSQSVTVAKMSFIRGAESQYDLLALDYGGFTRQRLKGRNGKPMFTTNVYKRKKIEKQNGN